MGLDANGFTRKTYADLLDESQAKYKELFGEDVNPSAYTPLGIISRVQAYFYAKIWDVIEATYNSRFVRKADGVSLDFHGGDKSLPRNPALNSFVTLEFTGEPGHIIDLGEEFSTDGDVHFMLLDDVTLDELGNGSGEAVSVDTGAYNNVLPNTITTQIEPDDLVESVTNPLPAKGGADLESKESYRGRLLKANESNGKSTMTAVETALLNTPGVRSSNVIFNKTMEVDTEGNPPKSMHAYVLGGTADVIAESIFDSIGATTETVGAQIVQVADLSGTKHPVRFDYAEVVPIFIKTTITTNPQFGAEGAAQLKDAFISVIGGADSMNEYQRGLPMGEDVFLSKLFRVADKVVGIEDITIEIGKSAIAISPANIEISQKQVAETAVANIEVIVRA